jgi:hypothetical protein
VLAISHPPPSLPALATPFAHPALIANPWRAGALDAIAPHARVAVMGTGLTMADTVATLTGWATAGRSRLFAPRPAVARQPQRQQGTLAWRLSIRERCASGCGRSASMSRAAEQGLSWQVVLDAVRQQGQRIWQALTSPIASVSCVICALLGCPPLPRRAAGRRGAGAAPARRQPAGAGGQADGAGRRRAKAALTLAPRRGETLRVSVDHLILTTGPAHGG